MLFSIPLLIFFYYTRQITVTRGKVLRAYFAVMRGLRTFDLRIGLFAGGFEYSFVWVSGVGTFFWGKRVEV